MGRQSQKIICENSQNAKILKQSKRKNVKFFKMQKCENGQNRKNIKIDQNAYFLMVQMQKCKNGPNAKFLIQSNFKKMSKWSNCINVKTVKGKFHQKFSDFYQMYVKGSHISEVLV